MVGTLWEAGTPLPADPGAPREVEQVLRRKTFCPHPQKGRRIIVTYSSIMLGTAGSVISPFTTERANRRVTAASPTARRPADSIGKLSTDPLHDRVDRCGHRVKT